MIRALTVLAAAAACAAAPVLAADRAEPRGEVLAQGGQPGQPGRSDMDRRAPGSRDAPGMRREDGLMMRENIMTRGATLNPYPVYERRLPARFYRAGYRLTPGGYHRLRAMGFSPREVYMIANAANATFLPTRVFEDAIYRGLYARGIASEYNIDPYDLTRVRAEWRSRAWEQATGEKAITGEKLNVWW